jgi:inorganic pyrophosphatase
MVPGKELNIKVDHVYGREDALRVIEAAMTDYRESYGRFHETR